MDTVFESAFLKAAKKHAAIKKQVKKKVDMIIENPIVFNEIFNSFCGQKDSICNCPKFFPFRCI